MRVGVSGKVLERNVGGNSTYARALYERLRPLGVQAAPLAPPGSRGPARAVSYALADGLLWPRRGGVDLLHYPADTGALIPAKVPVAATIHGLPPHRSGGLRHALTERVWYRRVGGMAAVADAVVTVSEFSAGEIHRTFGVPLRRLHVIPHGVDTSRFHTGGDRDAELLAPLKLPPRFALFLGSPAPRKNVPLLAEATARLDVPLVAAGVPVAGDEAVVRKLEAAPHVRWLGAIPGELVGPLLRTAAVLAIPSTHEGFGMPVLEAMACGTPVVISDRGALPEVAGGAARIVRELTVPALAAALAEVLDDDGLAAGLRERGLARAREFTWDRAAQRHFEVFGELVG